MKLGLFTISYAGFWGQDTLPMDAVPAKAKALGYDGIMIAAKRPHAFPAEMSEARRSEFRKALKENGQELCCVGAYTNFTAGIESGEVPLIDMQADYVGQCARLARDLGGNTVRIFTGYEVDRVPFTQLWSMCVKGVQASCDAAAPFGVTIGVQNHHDIGVHTAALDEFIRDVNRPNCAPFLDAWSPALRGEDLVAAAKSVGKRTPQTIVADYVRLPRAKYLPDLVDYKEAGPDAVRAVPMGEGFIDYKGFLRGLREGGFDGWVIYEMCSPLRGGGSMQNLDHCAKRFVEYMKKLG